jgi:SAM-dependent methyltransferase
MMRLRTVAGTLLFVSIIAAQNRGPKHPPDVPYVPTSNTVVDAMLKLAGIKSADVVYDLGCGDGRIVVAAAKTYGAHAVGVDINPLRIEEANANAKAAGVQSLVKFEENDLFDADIHTATVVALYLLPDINIKLRPKLLKELKPGTRIVSHTFDMGEWQPEKEERVDGAMIYLWTVPERK